MGARCAIFAASHIGVTEWRGTPLPMIRLQAKTRKRAGIPQQTSDLENIFRSSVTTLSHFRRPWRRLVA
jgi:hypothetical protein